MKNDQNSSMLVGCLSFLVVYPAFVVLTTGVLYYLFEFVFARFRSSSDVQAPIVLLTTGSVVLVVSYIFWKHSYADSGRGSRLQNVFVQIPILPFVLVGLLAGFILSATVHYLSTAGWFGSIGIGFGVAVFFPWLFRTGMFVYRMYRSFTNPLSILPTGNNAKLDCPSCGTSLEEEVEREVVRRFTCPQCNRKILTAPVSQERLDRLWEETEEELVLRCKNCAASIELPGELREYDIYCHRCDTLIEE